MKNKRIIKDIFFDVPKSHRIKNFLLKFFSKQDTNLYPPSISRTHRNYYLISKDPYIIIILEPINDIQLFSKTIGEKKDIVFLKFFSWTLYDKPYLLDRTIFDYKRHLQNYPKHKLILLLNTEEEYNYFKKNDIDCYFINHNSFVDPQLFKPSEVAKKYDVVYNGRLELGKRHYLLKLCKSIALISAPILRQNEQKKKYLEMLKDYIPNAKIFNFPDGINLGAIQTLENIPQLRPESISKILNLSKVGVILSYKEGACYASIEYLLSGIPLVTTKNIGGRDIFFDDRFCIRSLSNSFSVKHNIQKLIEKDIKPNIIREATLIKMKPHINRMKNLILHIFKLYGNSNIDIEKFWKDKFINKMLKISQKFPEELEKEIK